MTLRNALREARIEYVSHYGIWPKKTMLPFFRRKELILDIDVSCLNFVASYDLLGEEMLDGLPIKYWNRDYIELSL